VVENYGAEVVERKRAGSGRYRDSFVTDLCTTTRQKLTIQRSKSGLQVVILLSFVFENVAAAIRVLHLKC